MSKWSYDATYATDAEVIRYGNRLIHVVPMGDGKVSVAGYLVDDQRRMRECVGSFPMLESADRDAIAAARQELRLKLEAR